eukprot:10123-Heterococcus_DN1.PRE.3
MLLIVKRAHQYTTHITHWHYAAFACSSRDGIQLKQLLPSINLLYRTNTHTHTQASSTHQHNSNNHSFQLDPVQQQFWGQPSGSFPAELSVHAGEPSAPTSGTAAAQHSGAVTTTPRSNSNASANGHAVLSSKPPTPRAKAGAAEQHIAKQKLQPTLVLTYGMLLLSPASKRQLFNKRANSHGSVSSSTAHVTPAATVTQTTVSGVPTSPLSAVHAHSGSSVTADSSTTDCAITTATATATVTSSTMQQQQHAVLPVVHEDSSRETKLHSVESDLQELAVELQHRKQSSCSSSGTISSSVSSGSSSGTQKLFGQALIAKVTSNEQQHQRQQSTCSSSSNSHVSARRNSTEFSSTRHSYTPAAVVIARSSSSNNTAPRQTEVIVSPLSADVLADKGIADSSDTSNSGRSSCMAEEVMSVRRGSRVDELISLWDTNKRNKAGGA